MTEKKRLLRGIAAFALILAAGLTACDNGTTPENETKKAGETDETVLEIVETKVYETAGFYVGDADAPQSGITGLTASFDWIKENAVDNGSYVIALTANESFTAESGAAKTLDSAAVNGKTGVTIALTGVDGERVISLTTSAQGSLFVVSAPLRLVLGKNITLKGRSDNNKAVVAISGGGKLKMLAGSKVTGNTSGGYGGGVWVSNGTFTMTGGEIYGNTSGGYGGGVWVGSSTFTMTGGEIYGNTSGGSSSSGGGVYLTISPNNVFKKTGGVIYGNENAVNAEKRNKVLGFEGTALPNYGDAVYVKFSDGSRKRRETSTMENDNLDSTTTTGWIIPEN